jgi:CRP/FNR family transcriptional activator FtrB
MPDTIHPDVRALRLFSRMDEENYAALMRAAYVQTFPPQVQLISEGEAADFLYVIISGSVELFASWNGRETSMATVRPISTFILAATVNEAPYLMSARTAEKSRITLIPSQDVRAVFDADNEFARAIVTELAQCYRSVVKSHKDLKLRNSQERLANYLLRQQALSGCETSFELRLEKRRLASFLSMTPENLSRALKSLQEHGVYVNGNTVEIADRPLLTALAKPSALIDDFST